MILLTNIISKTLETIFDYIFSHAYLTLLFGVVCLFFSFFILRKVVLQKEPLFKWQPGLQPNFSLLVSGIAMMFLGFFSIYKLIRNCFFLFSLLITQTVIGQIIENNKQIDCSDFKIGTFNYELLPAAYSIRDEKKQFGYSPDGLIFESDVEWISECEFVLTFVKSNKEQQTYKVGDKTRVVINSVNGDCYTFIAYKNGKEYPPGEMCKVVVKQ